MAGPESPTVEKVATPLEAVAVAVPTTVAPVLTVIVTTEVLSEVTVFPPESWMATAGWVVKAAPLAAPAAEVVTANWVAEPVVRVMGWVAVVREPLEKVRV